MVLRMSTIIAYAGLRLEGMQCHELEINLTKSSLISFSGTASGNLVHISMVVSMYLCPSEGGLIGPMISTHTSQKRQSQLMVTFPLAL